VVGGGTGCLNKVLEE